MGRLLCPMSFALTRFDFAKHPHPSGIGKPRVPNRVCLIGIVFMLKSGIP